MTDIHGVYAAALSARRNSDTIDQGAIWEMIDFLSAAHVNGIVLFGSTGEFVHFSVEERTRVVGLAAKRSRVPIAVNVSHSTLQGAIELARAAEESGAAALLLMPPYFFRYEQADLLAFYRAFLRLAGVSVPVLLYHIPLFTSPIAVDTVSALLEEGYAGIKDSSGSWENYESLRAIATAKPFTLMMGNDGLYSRAYPLGSLSGVISGIASAVPELLVALDRALAAGAQELITRYDARLAQFMEQIDRFPVPIGVREAALARKLKLGPHAVPCDTEPFREWFAAWLPQVLKECAHATM